MTRLLSGRWNLRWPEGWMVTAAGRGERRGIVLGWPTHPLRHKSHSLPPAARGGAGSAGVM